MEGWTKKMIYGKTPINLLNDSRICFNDLRVYIALASFQGTNPDCFSSLKAISERSGVFVSHISKHTKRLQKFGWIEVVRRGKKKSNRYIVKSDSPLSGNSQKDLKSDSPLSDMSDLPKSGDSIIKEQLKQQLIELAKLLINRVGNEKALYSITNKFEKLIDVEKILRGCIKRGVKFESEKQLAAYLQVCIRSNGGNKPGIDTVENDAEYKKWQKERETV